MGERSPAGVTRKFSGIFFAPSLAVVPGTEYDVITEMLPLFLIFLPTYIYTYTFSFFFFRVSLFVLEVSNVVEAREVKLVGSDIEICTRSETCSVPSEHVCAELAVLSG